MKKLLVWIACLFVASLLVAFVPDVVRKLTYNHYEGYLIGYHAPLIFSDDPERQNAIFVWIATAVLYGVAFSIGFAITKRMPSRKDRETMYLNPNKKEAEKKEPVSLPVAAPIHDGEAALLPIPDIPDYGECPKCHYRNRLSRKTCFSCGLVFRQESDGNDA